MEPDLDSAFRALANPIRRAVLDGLRTGPATTNSIAAGFPHLSRYAVMKHLAVLVDAGLVVVERRGRERLNYLNPIPIRQIYERWITSFSELWASAALGLREYVERGSSDKHPKEKT